MEESMQGRRRLLWPGDEQVTLYRRSDQVDTSRRDALIVVEAESLGARITVAWPVSRPTTLVLQFGRTSPPSSIPGYVQHWQGSGSQFADLPSDELIESLHDTLELDVAAAAAMLLTLVTPRRDNDTEGTTVTGDTQEPSGVQDPLALWPLPYAWLQNPLLHYKLDEGVAVADAHHVLLVVQHDHPIVGFMRESLDELVAQLSIRAIEYCERPEAEAHLAALALDRPSLDQRAPIFQPCVGGSFIVRHVPREVSNVQEG